MPSEVREHYDRLAENYDLVRFRKPYHRRVDFKEREFVASRIPHGAEVVEVGSGSGRFTVELLKVASGVTVVDISREMLSVIRRNIGNPPNLRLIEGDLFQLDKLVGSEKYDMVVSMRVLPHLEAKHIALSKFNSVLRPGGTAIFDFWNGRSFIGLGRRLLRRRLDVPIFYVDYKTMLKLIAKAGFRVVGSFAWGYPRLGSFSLDRVGDRLAKRFGYSVVFNAKKN